MWLDVFAVGSVIARAFAGADAAVLGGTIDGVAAGLTADAGTGADAGSETDSGAGAGMASGLGERASCFVA